MNPSLNFFVISIIMLFIAGAVKRSGFIDTLLDFSLKMGRTERQQSFLMLLIFYILSPLFLGIPLISGLQRKSGVFKDRKSALTFFTFSAIFGSMLLPFGNLRNMFLADYQNYIQPGAASSMLYFPHLFIFLYTSMLIIQAFSIPFIFGNNKPQLDIVVKRFRWQELVFSAIIYLFIVIYYGRKMYFAGLVLLSGIFIFSFVGKETLKKMDWWMLLVSIPAIPIFLFTKAHPLHFKQGWDIAIPFLSSGFINANISAYLFSEPLMNIPHIFVAIAAGAVIPVIGGYEFIYLFFIRKEKISWKLSILFAGIFIVLAAISQLMR